jgi:translation initiation factor 4G
MHPLIRPATEADVPFVAWVMQEASRSHLPYGVWDIAFPGPDEWRLAALERLARAQAKSLCHWSGFLIAEVDGLPAAGLTGYENPSLTGGRALLAAMQEACAGIGWGSAQGEALGARLASFTECLPETPDDRYVIEFVATRPEHRGKGVVKALLEAVVARSRDLGHARTQVAVLIGNHPAQRAYEGAGFRVVDERRSPAFEATYVCPGIRRLLR